MRMTVGDKMQFTAQAMDKDDRPLPNITFRWFTSIWQNDAIIDATIRSLTIAPIAALVATVANAAGLKERAPRAAGVGVGFVAEPTPEPAPVLAPGKH